MESVFYDKICEHGDVKSDEIDDDDDEEEEEEEEEEDDDDDDDDDDEEDDDDGDDDDDKCNGSGGQTCNDEYPDQMNVKCAECMWFRSENEVCRTDNQNSIPELRQEAG